MINEEDLLIYFEDEKDDLEVIERLVVVIIMGYVDYGKMILLDLICYIKVIVGEVGGII